MIFTHRRARRLLPVLAVAVAACGAAAQQPDATRWTAVAGIELRENEAGMWFDQAGPILLRSANTDDRKTYPFARLLVSYRQAHHGDLGSYRSRIELIVFDCAGRRTQSLQSRTYQLPDGRGSSSMVAGTLSAWAWNKAGDAAQDARISAAVLNRYCPAGG